MSYNKSFFHLGDYFLWSYSFCAEKKQSETKSGKKSQTTLKQKPDFKCMCMNFNKVLEIKKMQALCRLSHYKQQYQNMHTQRLKKKIIFSVFSHHEMTCFTTLKAAECQWSGSVFINSLNDSIATAFNTFANKQKLERGCWHAGPGIDFQCSWQIGDKLERLGI